MAWVLSALGSGALIWGVYWLINRAPAAQGSPDLVREDVETEELAGSEDSSAQALRSVLLSREELLRAADRYENSGDAEGAAAARKAAAALESAKTSGSEIGRKTEIAVDFGSSDDS